MQNAEQADFRAQVLGISRYLEKGLCGRREQQAVKQPRVLQRQDVELVRNGEDDMKVAGGQQFPFSGCQPPLPEFVLVQKPGALRAENIGHLHGGPAHSRAS